MRNRFTALIIEAALLHLLTLFFVWKLYIVPRTGDGTADKVMDSAGNGMMIIAVVCLAVLLFVGV